jgi:iron complex outermembrane recepter protein
VRSLDNLGVFKALLLAGCAGTMAIASPAVAQEDTEDEDGADIIVTGSRIQRPDFNSNSPAISVDEALLENSSTAALEVNLNKLPQFTPAQTPTAGGDIQPTATNTPGAATISLRGVGSNRNLVLVDGRRSTPSNASGVTDISTIPSAAIERVEIISGGASATYGADAVAGVTNFILKKNFQGLELDGRLGITEEGDGFEYQFSGIMGADFDDGRGNVSLALSVNTREGSYQRDRDHYRDLWADPQTGGTQFFIDRPGVILGFFNPVVPTAGQGGVTTNAFFNIFNQATPNPRAPLPPPSTNCAPNTNLPTQIDSGGCLVFFPGAANSFAGIQGFNVFANPDGSAFTGTGFAQRGGAYRYNGGFQNGYEITAAGTLAKNNENLYLILPLTRYNAFARGNYEINDWIGVFGQALFSHVSTYTRNEPGPITNGWDVFLPYGSGAYTGSAAPGTNFGTGNPSSILFGGQTYDHDANPATPAIPFVDTTPTNYNDNPTNPAFGTIYGSQFACANAATNPIGGCTNTQVLGSFLPAELQTILNARQNPNAPVQLTGLMPDDRETFTDVMTYNITTGLEGSIPGTDWTWEAFVNHGESHTFAKQTGVYSLERTQTLLSSPGFGRGFTRSSNPESNNFGAGFGTCTTGVNFFNVPAGGFSENCLEAMRADLKNRSKFRQTIVEANLQGGLFDIWAGTIRGAVGASYREMQYEFTNDTLTTQGRSFLDQALGIYPSGQVNALIDVKEVYGELLIPIIADVPFIQELNLEVGGRMSDYSTTGTSWTYKVLADWSINDWLRFRGGFNRAERAPNIGELFLAAQQTFGVNNAGDVCSRLNPNNFSANPATNAGGAAGAANVEATCRALMAQASPEAAGQYYAGVQSTATFGFAFPTLVGNPNLTPEKADTWTAGLVIQSPFSGGVLSRLRASVDFYDITIKDAIGAQTIGAVSRQCYDPTFNPLVSGASGSAAAAAAAAASPFCQLLPRNGTGQLGNVGITYANSGRVHLQGIDAQLDWGMDVGPGTVTLNSVFNYQIDFESSALFPQLPLVEFAGTTGAGENGLNANPFKYRALTTLGYGMGPWRASLQWQYYDGLDLPAPSVNVGWGDYSLFNLNGSYQLTEDIGLRFGVDNLLNKEPELGNYNPAITNAVSQATGQLRGGSFLTGVQDTDGRRYYIGGNVRF